MNNLTIQINIKWEGLHDGSLQKIGLQPKMDPSEIWTEGYGRAMIDPRNGNFLKGKKNEKIANELATIDNEEEAYNDLILSLKMYSKMAEYALQKKYWEKLNENQKGALTTFVRNCGTTNKITKKHYFIFEYIRKYIDNEISAESLIKYWETSITKSNGVELKGLILRRADEAKLFFTPLI
jgi:GH24 family phage-related lysozyme (muramidase)